MDEAAHDAKFMELTAGVIGKQAAQTLLTTLHALPADLHLAQLTALCAAA